MRRRHPWLGSLALVVLHVAVLAAQAPHLVHHVFEDDVVAPEECAFATAADHGPGVVAADTSPPRPGDPSADLPATSGSPSILAAARPGAPRAPPRHLA